MATNCCTRVRFFDTTQTAFYFEEAINEVAEDAFSMSDLPVYQHLIGNNGNKFLILNTEDNFEVKNLNKDEQKEPANKFNIQIYKDSKLDGRKGRAVMLYVIKDKKKMVVCCNDKDEIHPEEMDLPREIGASAHKAVFYRTELAMSKYMLESSLYPTKFLGFKSDTEGDCALSKLALCNKSDEVDVSPELIFY